ncbi:MAG TPA: SAM-dependent methyltransferase [Polyangiaceae bacterium]|jgi:methyltransferase (TIGR00027 family)|nr:SAM-dependent methyltransferase [Polyangiaceae bacterium]
MREGKPSFTAAAVAAARAIARVDPLATALVDGPLSLVMRAGRRGRASAAAVNLATLGLVDHIELRTLAIDAALREAVAAGVRQLVVLGAGLDARAWRMPELAETRVYEVDHPSTQAYKQARIGARSPAAKEVRFVAVDFARDSLREAMERAGHDASAPTFWLWEGVTPYLPLEAIRATLAAVASRSAEESRIAVTYGTPQGSPLGGTAVRAARVAFRAIGEELLGLLTPDAMHEELAAVGFRLVEDLSAADWGARFGGGRRRLLFVDEHLAVAVSGGPPRASRAA